VLAAQRRAADAASIEWKSAVYRKIGEEVSAGRGLTIERMMELARVSRASFYRCSEEAKPDRDMDLRDAIQRIALEWPSDGRPRITAELRRRGWTVNPKRVYRLLRADNLLCVRKRKFVATADSNHGRKVDPNLAAGMVPTGVDQLWRADITYVRLREEFIFLAVILDAFSRRAIGWALDRNLEDELTLTALRMALSRRSIQPGLARHSDRGSQYASNEYTGLLKANLSVRCCNESPGAASVHRSRRFIGVDEFQPVIPKRDALQQRPPPLHRPCSACDKVILPVEIFAANGETSLNCLSQPRGQPQPSMRATSSGRCPFCNCRTAKVCRSIFAFAFLVRCFPRVSCPGRTTSVTPAAFRTRWIRRDQR
jgi:hypothetical protein